MYMYGLRVVDMYVCLYVCMREKVVSGWQESVVRIRGRRRKARRGEGKEGRGEGRSVYIGG
jgi:hypothetical protein